MTSNILTRTQQSTMLRAEKTGPVIIAAKNTAYWLVQHGYMQYASIDPPPKVGIAVALTTKGYSWCKTGGTKRT